MGDRGGDGDGGGGVCDNCDNSCCDTDVGSAAVVSWRDRILLLCNGTLSSDTLWRLLLLDAIESSRQETRCDSAASGVDSLCVGVAGEPGTGDRRVGGGGGSVWRRVGELCKPVTIDDDDDADVDDVDDVTDDKNDDAAETCPL
jgi:hypothetical protein